MWLAVVLVLALGQVAERPPLAIKGVAPGDSPSKVMDAWEIVSAPRVVGCYPAPTVDGDCSTLNGSLAGQPAFLLATFKNGIVCQAAAIMGTEHFQIVKGAFVSKYGEADKSSTEPVVNRMGATFDNESLTWASGDVVLNIDRRGGSIDKMSVSIKSISCVNSELSEKVEQGKDDI